MKTLPVLTVVLLAFITIAPSSPGAPANPYDTFAKVLMPFVNVLAKNSRAPEKAFTATLELESATGAPEELKAGRLEISFQAPNKLKLRGPVLGEQATICRKGQKLWVAPGQKIESIIAAASEGRAFPPPNPEYQLAPFSLPFPEKQLVFLPALFQVQALPDEEIAGEACRVIDVRLMPELERSLKGAAGWTARVWVNPDGKPARIQVTGPKTSVRVRVAALQFTPELSKETWSPAVGEDALKIPPARYDQLMRALLGGK